MKELFRTCAIICYLIPYSCRTSCKLWSKHDKRKQSFGDYAGGFASAKAAWNTTRRRKLDGGGVAKVLAIFKKHDTKNIENDEGKIIGSSFGASLQKYNKDTLSRSVVDCGAMAWRGINMMKKRYFIIHVAIASVTDLEKCVFKLEEVAWLKTKQATMKCYDYYNDEDVQVYLYARHWHENSEFPFVYVSRKILRERLAKLFLHPYRK
jgi:hypothetical protein